MESTTGLQTGKSLDEFLLEEHIGIGGFADVYSGSSHLVPGRKVAVKVLKDIKSRKRLECEVNALQTMKPHPNIVILYDANVNHANPYAVMELADSTVEKEISQHGIEWKKAVGYTIETLDGLEHAHKSGIIHGDIKPSNLLVCNDHVKVSDFNAAKLADMRNSGEIEFSQTLDDGKTAKSGTMYYSTPEHRRGEELTAASDTHQVGQTLYEMITGIKFMDKEGNASERGAPIWVDTIINRATNNNKNIRYASAKEMRNALFDGLAGKYDVPMKKKVWRALRPVVNVLTFPFLAGEKLAKKVEDKTGYDSDGVFTRIAYYGALAAAAAIFLGVRSEYKWEREIVTQAKQVAQEAKPNQQLFTIIDENTIGIKPLKDILDSRISSSKIKVGSPIKNSSDILGADGSKVYYRGVEEFKNGTNKYPQIYVLDVNTGVTTPVIDYRNTQRNQWTITKGISFNYSIPLFSSIIGKDEATGRIRPLIQFDNKWFEYMPGDYFMPTENVPNHALSRNTELSKNLELSEVYSWRMGNDQIRVNYKGSVIGDKMIMPGESPLILEYEPKAEKGY